MLVLVPRNHSHYLLHRLGCSAESSLLLSIPAVWGLGQLGCNAGEMGEFPSSRVFKEEKRSFCVLLICLCRSAGFRLCSTCHGVLGSGTQEQEEK